MDTNKMREQFEAWHSGKYGWPLRNYAYYWDGTCYEDEEFQLAWDSWQASREALVVELPNRASEAYCEHFDDVEGGSFNEAAYIRDVRKAIEAQGLKVAP